MITELKNFYKENNIKYFSDGFSTEVWYYKDVEIAYYMDFNEPEGYVYIANQWALNKRNYQFQHRNILPVYKNKKNLKKFEPNDIGSEEFKNSLLNSCREFDKVEFKLKDKIHMYELYKTRNLTINECLEYLDDIKIIELKETGKSKLKNGLKFTGNYKIIEGKNKTSELWELTIEKEKYILIRTEFEDRWWNQLVGKIKNG